MKDTGYCKYCQAELPCGEITDAAGGAKDLLQYDFNFMGEDLSMYVSVDEGKLIFVNYDYNPFASVRIEYCPMCGRKLEHWDDFEVED